MSVKSAIKKILPVSLIEKRQRWKTNRALQHEGKREFRNFAQSYAAPECSDQVQMESLLIFFVHQIEKGFSSILISMVVVAGLYVMPLIYRQDFQRSILNGVTIRSIKT